MRIAFVARRCWPATGGIESYMRHVAVELARRHELVVVAQRIDDGPARRTEDALRPPAPFVPFAADGVEVRPLRLTAARRALMAPLVVQVAPGVRRHAHGRSRHAATRLYAHAVAPVLAEALAGADVVHVWGGDMLGGAALRAGRLVGAPILITPFAHEGRWGDDPAAARTYRHADRVLALLEAEAGLYRRLGVRQERIEVVGVASPGVEPGGGAALRRRLGIGGPLVLFLGARRPYKGFELLLEAAPLVRRCHPEATFAFVGPGRRVDGTAVVDAGAVDDAERAAWLEAADVLCLPSESEILPSSFLEAWSVGTPVVTSDIPPLEELVTASGGGLAVPREGAALAEALSGLLADRAQLEALGRRGRDYWSRHLTVEAVAARHERLYESVAPRRAAA